mmetsp:Transcript_6962/g.8417  ORF Transcript_6962/g.8417 Transcript_6962/m.8417 type:complete len:541 (-) Transcript_6962:165-1787(-)|eukprot:CAMPEP_0204837794 /NCGR_PEP_ID=MMETSP1346-20131115/29030_1 /ASSEMBLY_ACC=CAM_ASM_000771 /TAXON_ID=215587 /ORGANISM="Aplanochytrium stocchinoi, Strain GSBS06" /LENGTH=540 /DNA_ID=CAMNT_0051973463 /DNA_START=18 /DNA_END=1640 /DNA_ORIENTATION=+
MMSSSDDNSGSENGSSGFVMFKAGSTKKQPSSDSQRQKLKGKTRRRKGIGLDKIEDQNDTFEMGFAKLGLSQWLCRSCGLLGMRQPTPIQTACIPATLDGKNIIASAQTGSGKTAAFAIPILETLALDPYGIYAVVLTPTRELAFQIGEQFHALGASMRIKCEVVVGGVSMLQQAVALASRPHIVVATPGRLAGHIESAEPPRLKNAKYVVLDEADRLLEDSFQEDLAVIMSMLPAKHKRQTLLYSATMTNTLEHLKSTFQISKSDSGTSNGLFEFHATKTDTTVDTLDERYLVVPDQIKHAYLGYVMRIWGPADVEKSALSVKSKSLKSKKRRRPRDVVHVETVDETENENESEDESDDDNKIIFEDKRAGLMIIFVSTCKTCQLIGETLLELGVNCVSLHSYLSQNRRLAALGKFRSGIAKILVATDVASRGLDIPEVDLVLNYDVPRNPEDYIHRAGRTARAGRVGRAITFITQYDVNLVIAIEKATGKKMILLSDVEEDDVLVLLTRVSNARQAAKLRIEDTGQTIVKRSKRKSAA